MDVSMCRVCLCKRTRSSKKLNENTTEGFSYSDMLKRITSVEVDDDAILCSSCCLDLLLCFKFLLKVEESNKIWTSDKSLTDTHKPSEVFNSADVVKDPLEDSDESAFEDKTCYGAENDSNGEDDIDELSKELLDCSTKPPSSKLNDLHSNVRQEFDDDEALFNDLSDLTVSAENLIFPRGHFKCKICEKTYFTTVGLIAHQEVHLPKTPTAKKKRLRGAEKQKLSKVTTDTEANNASSMQTHLLSKRETLSKLNKPSEMDPYAERNVSVKSRKEKQLKPKKMFPCEVCGKHMISASKLRYHMVMHTGEKDFLCSMCPKAYSTIYALKHHFRSHTGDRPYKCTFCGDSFFRPTTLKSHVRRHTGERPYGCDVCGKRFIQHSSMTTHIKLNHMAKTIPCPHCDKKYARQTDLNTHMLSHTGDKPFRCQLCPSRFIRQANLNKHMNQHHSAKSKQNRGKERLEVEEQVSATTRNEIPLSSLRSQTAQDIKSAYDLLVDEHGTSTVLEHISDTALETWTK